jgi:hypothetical protein
VTIKVTYADKTNRSVNSDSLLDSWDDNIDSIPTWCLHLLNAPRFNTNSIVTEEGAPFSLNPTQVLVTPRSEWYLIFPQGCWLATRDWRGRISISGNKIATLPTDAEPAARWGNGHIHAKRNCFPLAAEFTFNNDGTPLDQLTVKKLSYLISKRGRQPPTCIKKWTYTLTPLPRGSTPLDWKAISSVFTSAFLSSKDFHLHYKHIIHRAIVTRHTYPATHQRREALMNVPSTWGLAPSF